MFIYLSYFNIEFKVLNTIFAIVGFYIILHENKKTLFYLGFFVGIFWFYWISLSLIYYQLIYLIPLGIIGIAFIYAVIFYIIGIFPNIFRIIPIILLEYIHPFYFNYLNPKLPLVNSYLKTDDISFVLFLLIMYFIGYIHKSKKMKTRYIIIIFPIIFTPNIFSEEINLKKPSLDIELVRTDINQDEKWKIKNVNKFTNANFDLIENAIKNKKDMIVFPETTFEIPLNQDYITTNKLKEYSKNIAIVAGSSYIDNINKYNSTYIFDNTKMQIIHKYILTPFGERVPLPEPITKKINDVFFNGSSDFNSASSYGEFTIKGYTFRNAICFEATRDEIYKDNPKYLIAISNNAWFAPSIQSSLQNIYLKYMSQKYNTIIYHSTNKGKNTIIN